MGVTTSHEDALRALQAVDLCSQVIGDLVVPAGVPCPCPYCGLRRVDASYLDAVQVDLDNVLKESRIGAATALALWEVTLGLSDGSGLTVEERRARLIAVRTKKGGLSKAYFMTLAAEMGYIITIDRGVMPFRAGISKAGDPARRVNRLTTADPSDALDLRNGSSYPVALTPTGHGSLGSESAAARTTKPVYPSDFWVWVVTIKSIGSNVDSSRLKERFEALKPAYSIIVWKDGTGVFIDAAGIGALQGRPLRIIDAGSITNETPIYDFPETL